MTLPFAYIDPASGAIAIQLVVAALAGGIMYCRRFVATAVRKIFGKASNEE
jgi:hypothetical protein